MTTASDPPPDPELLAAAEYILAEGNPNVMKYAWFSASPIPNALLASSDGGLTALGARLDQGQRPPDLRTRVIGPFTRADHRYRHAGQRQRAVLAAR